MVALRRSVVELCEPANSNMLRPFRRNTHTHKSYEKIRYSHSCQVQAILCGQVLNLCHFGHQLCVFHCDMSNRLLLALDSEVVLNAVAAAACAMVLLSFHCDGRVVS